MRKILGGVSVLALCFCGVRLAAQETVSQGMSPSEAKPGVSRGVSVCMTAKGQNSFRFSHPTVDPKILKNENRTEGTPPFPVSIPATIVYPKKAIRRGWEGQTVVAAEILPNGSVGRTALAKSSGHEVLDHAAQEAIQTWKFAAEPGNDPVVSQYVDIPVTFKLEGRELQGEN